MEKSTEISERIDYVRQYLGFNKSSFADMLGYERAQSVYDIINGKSNPSFDFFVRWFNTEYSALFNAKWLLTGNGDMIPDKTVERDKSEKLREMYQNNKKVREIWDTLYFDKGGDDYLGLKMASKMAGNVASIEQKEPNIKTFTLRTDRNLENQRVPLYDLEAVAGLVPLFTGKAVSEPEDFIQIPHLPKCDGAVYVTGDSMYPLLKSGDMVMYKEVKDIKNDIFFGEMYLLSLDMSGEEYVTVKFVQRSEQDGYVTLVSHNSHHQPKEVRMDKIKALALVKASIRINSMN